MSDEATPEPARKPARRKRYPGTHPRAFEQRYKELAAEQFPAEIAKVVARGQTPAGAHRPVMLDEVLLALRPAEGETALDCTLGRAGHAQALLERVGPRGIVIGLDRDAEELERTRVLLSSADLPIRTHHSNFAGADKVLRAEGLDAVDLVLADLGLSSMQLDRPERGFSFKTDGPLDLRMDRSRGVPASEWLASQTEVELADALREFGDEPDAGEIAARLRRRTLHGPRVATTRELAALVLDAKGFAERRYRQSSAFDSHPAARTFQALRVALNRELESLAQLLRILPWILRPGGRAALIAFHSGERTRIEAALADGVTQGLYRAISTEPIPPSRAEVGSNPRARSARLSWAERAV